MIKYLVWYRNIQKCFKYLLKINKILILNKMYYMFLFQGILFVTMLGIVASEFAFSSQHIHKYDGHHELVDHGHEHHDYYVNTFLIMSVL